MQAEPDGHAVTPQAIRAGSAGKAAASDTVGLAKVGKAYKLCIYIFQGALAVP